MTSPTPPPDTTSPDFYQQALALLDTIDILTASVKSRATEAKDPASDTQALGQAILKRGEHVDQLVRLFQANSQLLASKKLSQEARQVLFQRLADCQADDTLINQHLGSAIGSLDSQMQQLHRGRQILQHYQQPVSDARDITREENA